MMAAGGKGTMMAGGGKAKMMAGGGKAKMMASGGMPMVMKGGQEVPAFAADGKGQDGCWWSCQNDGWWR
jgi:hypothetical protein